MTVREPRLRMLDCFCGMGGVSDGFALEGFDVTGIDIIQAHSQLGYAHKFIHAAIQDLDGAQFADYDVIWGSPPYRDFSTQTQANKGYSNRTPPNPIYGLALIVAFRQFVEKAHPRIWLMENVRRLEKFWFEQPVLHFLVSKQGKRSLWGNIKFPMMQDIRPQRNMEHDYTKYSYRMRSALRSRIPVEWSRAFARVCKRELTA